MVSWQRVCLEKLVIIEHYSTPLYDVIDLDCDIFLLNETVEKISLSAKNKLKKRVFIFDSIKDLKKAIEDYDPKKIKKLRNNSFSLSYVNEGHLDNSLEKIIRKKIN